MEPEGHVLMSRSLAVRGEVVGRLPACLARLAGRDHLAANTAQTSVLGNLLHLLDGGRALLGDGRAVPFAPV
eukprot:5200794-Prymnesium_polylepis.1